MWSKRTKTASVPNETGVPDYDARAQLIRNQIRAGDPKYPHHDFYTELTDQVKDHHLSGLLMDAGSPNDTLVHKIVDNAILNFAKDTSVAETCRLDEQKYDWSLIKQLHSQDLHGIASGYIDTEVATACEKGVSAYMMDSARADQRTHRI